MHPSIYIPLCVLVAANECSVHLGIQLFVVAFHGSGSCSSVQVVFITHLDMRHYKYKMHTHTVLIDIIKLFCFLSCSSSCVYLQPSSSYLCISYIFNCAIDVAE